MPDFQVIQGGMGVGVSNWRLARAVAQCGQLGVVSGTGLAVVLARRLQQGDPSGDMRRGLAAFPFPAIAQAILQKYFVADRVEGTPRYRLTPMPLAQNTQSLVELTVAANFVEVYLAKQGHAGLVGLNLLEKVQVATLASLYGAMLAGVDYVLMGAGIPRMIPGALDALAAGRPAELRVDVAQAGPGEVFQSRFDPCEIVGSGTPPVLARPRFLAIVSSSTLALTLARKSNGRVDGFVVETPVAGGHNAPPRGALSLNARGEPVYGERDHADLAKIREIGLPYYLAGGYASPAGLAQARAGGARGIQVGTLFAFCAESAIEPGLKSATLARAQAGTVEVRTDPLASPTGFPFKVLKMPGTLSQAQVYAARPRICDVGYLRQAYRKTDGTVGYRCPAEPVGDYVNKGGVAADTVGRKCLCNGLFSTLGLGQVTAAGVAEPPLLTSGDDVVNLPQVLRWAARKRAVAPGNDSLARADSPDALGGYTAADVLGYLLES